MHTLMVKGHYLRLDMCLMKESEVQRMKRVSYSSVTKSLYTVVCAKLGICFLVGFVSRFSVCEVEKKKLFDTRREMS